MLSSLVVLLFGFLTVEARAASQVCVAEPNENPLVQGRSKTLTFPDGRTLTVVGHLHGSRQIYEVIELMNKGQLASMSDHEFNELLAKIINENSKPHQAMITRQDKKKFVEHFKSQYGLDVNSIVRPENGFDLPSMTVEDHAISDYQFLSKALQDGSKIQFVGYEGSQATWNSNFPIYLRAQQELLRQFYLRKARGQIRFSRAQLENMILSSSNGSVYAYMQNPNLSKQVTMFGTEDQKVGLAYQNAQPLKKMNDALQRLVREDDLYWESKTEKEQEAFKAVPSNLAFTALLGHVYSEVQNMNISSYSELDEMVKGLREKSPPWIRPSLENLIAAFKDRVRHNFARDYESAKNLVERYESGIHFVGLNHFKNTIANLEYFCGQEIRAPGSRAAAPASAVQ